MDKGGITYDCHDFTPTDSSIVVILRGEGNYTTNDGEQHALRAGHCFLRLSGRRHTTTINPDSAWFEVFFAIDSALTHTFVANTLLDPNLISWPSGNTLLS